MQLKLVITLVASVLFMFTMDVEAKKKNNICINNRFHLKPTNGHQIVKGSCSTTIQGEIPSKDHMPSTIIILPENGSTVRAKKNFTIEVQVDNAIVGDFSDPEKEYYTKPQCLSKDGLIIGHIHVVVQKIDKPKTPLDPTKFAFFQGINDAGVDIGKGVSRLNTTVDGGLSSGNYRLCTISGTETHQPWIMPVAKRGAQDDCIRFHVK